MNSGQDILPGQISHLEAKTLKLYLTQMHTPRKFVARDNRFASSVGRWRDGMGGMKQARRAVRHDPANLELLLAK
ncbi:MAG: hypothetical protein LBO79_11045 [Zoogloeaceae bacterium]|nr:hypothetical protein [Zoogloeaceae bacterium]